MKMNIRTKLIGRFVIAIAMTVGGSPSAGMALTPWTPRRTISFMNSCPKT